MTATKRQLDMYLLGYVLYFLFCVVTGWLLARALTPAGKAQLQWLVATVLAVAFLVIPLADEIVGYYQFEEICAKANTVHVYKTLPVGEALYTSDGRWKPAMLGEEGLRARRTLGTYLRQEHTRENVNGVIEIWAEQTRVYSATDGQVLAGWVTYGTSGGWLSRTLGAGGQRLIVRQQCVPDLVARSKVEQTILPMQRLSGGAK